MSGEVDAVEVILRAVKEIADKSHSIEDIRASIANILEECENKAVNEEDDDEDNCEGMTDEQFDSFIRTLAQLVSTAKTVEEAAEIVRSFRINK